MKKIINHTLSLSVAVLLLSGCSFLEVEKLGKNDIPKFFSNIDGLLFAKQGMYKELYVFCDGYYTKYAEAAADLIDLDKVGDMTDQFDYMSKPEDRGTAVGFIWEHGYSVLANANNIIKYAPDLKANFPQNLNFDR